MKNKVLKAMRRCTEKLEYGPFGDVVLDHGTLYATDRNVAVRYTEDWGLGSDVPQMAVPDDEVTAHKASQTVTVCEQGFSWDAAEFKAAKKDVAYPSEAIDRIFDKAAKEDGPLDGNKYVDPKLLAKVTAVFEAAEIDMKVLLHKGCVTMVGYKFEESRCVASLSALVMCKIASH